MQHASCPPWCMPVNIPLSPKADIKPVENWRSLRFSPIKAYHLHCWQGVFPGIKDFFITCQSRFCSADIPWFVSGMSCDGHHNHPPSLFYPSLVTLHKDTNYSQEKGERKILLAEVKDQVICLPLSSLVENQRHAGIG